MHFLVACAASSASTVVALQAMANGGSGRARSRSGARGRGRGRSGAMASGESTTEVQALRQLFPRVGKCVLCGIFAHASSHASNAGPEHTWKHLTDEELVEWATNRRGRTVNGRAVSAEGDDRIDFGGNCGRLLSDVQRTNPGWVEWLVNDAPALYLERPALQRALASLGYTRARRPSRARATNPLREPHH